MILDANAIHAFGSVLLVIGQVLLIAIAVRMEDPP